MWYRNIAGRFFGLVTKHACDRRTDRQTDRQTDGRQNYDSQDHTSIAVSRGKNWRFRNKSDWQRSGRQLAELTRSSFGG